MTSGGAAAETASGCESGAGGAFSDAANRIRDSAKYLLAAFAAVGAILVAGLQLANLGVLAVDRPDNRLQLAVGGVALAILGVAIAIGSATTVISRSFVTLHWLAQGRRGRRYDIDGDDALLASMGTANTLYQRFGKALEAQATAVQNLENSDSTAVARAASALEIVQARVQYYDRVTRNVIEQASYRRLRRAYTAARFGMLLGALLAAAGIALFAWAANPPADTMVPVLVSTPTETQLLIAPAAREGLQSQLGAACDLTKPLSAIALADRGEGYELAIVPNDSCNAGILTIGPNDGTVVPKAADSEPAG